MQKLKDLIRGNDLVVAPVVFNPIMAKMAAHPKMQEWWVIMEPMQEPVASHEPGEWWVRMPEAFHTD